MELARRGSTRDFRASILTLLAPVQLDKHASSPAELPGHHAGTKGAADAASVAFSLLDARPSA